MAFDKNSNGFTFGFATVLVVLVGVLLAFSFLQLKPAKDENVKNEKMQNILASMNVDVVRDEAPALYQQSLRESLILSPDGKVKQGDAMAFDVDLLKEYKACKAGVLDESEVNYPLFVCESEGQELYVIPLMGTGLWGPIWGYVSVKKDGKTIYGSTFDHKGETPGLGAEITMDFFEDQFPERTLVAADGSYTGISVVKAGKGDGRADAVDGITGGTITSDGVDEMLKRTLKVYDMYFKSL